MKSDKEKHYEVAIVIRDPSTYDSLVLALVKNGFEVYEGIKDSQISPRRICFAATNEEVHEIRNPHE